jgi:hypothetical protein
MSFLGEAQAKIYPFAGSSCGADSKGGTCIHAQGYSIRRSTGIDSHARFWNETDFTVEISSIMAWN